ncbi:MAG: glycoside hydrolase family 2, partial [Tannerellaceae bacterium]
MNTKHKICQIGRTILLISSLSFSVAQAQTTIESKYLVATNDCGNASNQGFLIKGDNYTLPLSIEGSEKARTCSFGSSIIYAFDKIDIHSDYWIEVTFLADAERTISISADGNAIVESIVIPKQQEIKKLIQLPRKAYAYGQLVLIFDVIKGPNAVVNELNIYSSNQKPLTAFAGDKKESLKATQSYIVDQNVDVEAVLPTYAPL